MAGDVADRYAVGRFLTDADGRRWFVLEGPSALTAAGAQDAYAAKLRERLNPPLQLSSDALFALHGVRGCKQHIPNHHATDLCIRHWRQAEGFVDSGGAPRVDPIPDPPVRMTRSIKPGKPRSEGAIIKGACVLCGSRNIYRTDQRGRNYGPKTMTRMLIGVFTIVPWITGARCDRCDAGVENEGNVLRWVARSLNKQVPSGEDIWALHVISARLAELPDPDPPSDPWGHTSVGQGADSDGDGIGPLTDDEITRLRSLLQKTKGR